MDTMRNSQTQCHCTSEECSKVDGYQSHPCGRCVKEGVTYIHARAPELWLCNACADYWDANDIHSKTRWTLERLTGLAKRAGILLLLLVALQGCSQAPKPNCQCDTTYGQDDATARAWADANRAAKEARP